MSYIPNTDADRQAMLQRIGVATFEELIINIPDEALFKGTLNLPAPLSEMEVMEHLHSLEKMNQNTE